MHIVLYGSVLTEKKRKDMADVSDPLITPITYNFSQLDNSTFFHFQKEELN